MAENLTPNSRKQDNILVNVYFLYQKTLLLKTVYQKTLLFTIVEYSPLLRGCLPIFWSPSAKCSGSSKVKRHPIWAQSLMLYPNIMLYHLYGIYFSSLNIYNRLCFLFLKTLRSSQTAFPRSSDFYRQWEGKIEKIDKIGLISLRQKTGSI